MPWYSGKQRIRDYLLKMNKEQVLEYCLFQPGMFTNYLVHPHASAKYFRSFETQFDFQTCRILMREGGDEDIITFTTVSDFVKVVTAAIDYPGKWPVVGGIKGSEVSIKELIALGEKIRGEFCLVTNSPAVHVNRPGPSTHTYILMIFPI